MTVHDIRKNAEEMGIPFKQAAWTRVRFLRERMNDVSADMGYYLNYLDQEPLSFGDAAVAAHLYRRELGKYLLLAKELHSLCRLVNGHQRKESITDQEIEIARLADIRTLIPFDHGKAHARCHEDKRPSLTYLSKTGRAWCPVCSRSWDAIAWLMDFEGLSFIEAVKRLQTS